MVTITTAAITTTTTITTATVHQPRPDVQNGLAECTLTA